MITVGISAALADSAVALIRDGSLIAAAQEERFTRLKHDPRFPHNALAWCLQFAGVSRDFVDCFALCVPPGIKDSYPAALGYPDSLPGDSDSLFLPDLTDAHAAAAFFPSPFNKAAIIVFDATRPGAPSVIAEGSADRLTVLDAIPYPHSPGLLYSACTAFCGFTPFSGEYKLMGLAPYGTPRYVSLFYDSLLSWHPDGYPVLNPACFDFLTPERLFSDQFFELFGFPARIPESPMTQQYADLARSVQAVIEDCMLKTVRRAYDMTGAPNLCMAGSLALNCVANSRIARESSFSSVWIQPAAGYAGCAVGAAFCAWHGRFNNPRSTDDHHDAMHGALLGPAFSEADISAFITAAGCRALKLHDAEWAETIARLVADHNVIGLLQGRMEFGPRALGNRTIIADPRSQAMQSLLNQKIKYRESFRPFAPACLEDHARLYFDLPVPSPYMLFVARLKEQRRLGRIPDVDSPLCCSATAHDLLAQIRSDIPAVTHVDYSARVQIVSKTLHGRFYDLLEAFFALTGCSVLINTSFNVRGEPIVCTPADAYRCFMTTEMDYLVLGSYLLDKRSQPPSENSL